MEITKNDIGRYVRLRNGDVAEIVAFDSGATYPVHISTATRQASLTARGWHYLEGQSEFDAIEFSDVKILTITDKDVGKYVKLRNGDVAEIIGFNSSDKHPVIISYLGRNHSLSSSGRQWYSSIGETKFDAVEFTDAPTAPETPSTASDLEELQQHIAKALSLLEAYPEAIHLEVTSGPLTVSLQKRTE